MFPVPSVPRIGGGRGRYALVMPIERISSLEDPRVACFAAVRERDLLRERGLFIAEGAFVVERLLRSELQVHGVLVSEQRAEAFAGLARPQVPVYACPEPLLHELVGFHLHQGVMAAAQPPDPSTWERFTGPPEVARVLVVCPQIADPENLGQILRTSAALGAAGVLLGPGGVHPWYRRCVRVSMGAALQMPIWRSDDLLADLDRLREQGGYELAATVLSPQAVPLAAWRPARRVAVLLGAEGPGLAPQVITRCCRQVSIPMAAGVDSLNVVVAGGIVLHHAIAHATGSSWFASS